MAKRIIYLAVCVSILFAPSLAGAQEGDPAEPVPEWVYPNYTERVVERSNAGFSALGGTCTTLRWSAWSVIREGVFSTDSQHVSRSRDNDDPSFPCDIDNIGVRGRIWVNDSLKSDTGWVENSDSADAVVDTANNLSECAPDDIYARGDHKFEEAGVQNWYPVTDDSC